MTNEEAIQLLEEMWMLLWTEMRNVTFSDIKESGKKTDFIVAHDMAIEALEQTDCGKCKYLVYDEIFDPETADEYDASYCNKQQSCDDCISRNDMLDVIGHGTTYTSEELQDIIKGMPLVQPEMKWTPVSERLPEDGERVLVTYDKIVIRATWDLMRYRFYDTHAASLDKDFVYAWMPLPEAYKAESEVHNADSD